MLLNKIYPIFSILRQHIFILFWSSSKLVIAVFSFHGRQYVLMKLKINNVLNMQNLTNNKFKNKFIQKPPYKPHYGSKNIFKYIFSSDISFLNLHIIVTYLDLI